MFNSLSIQTWPIFMVTDTRKTELWNKIDNDKTIIKRLRSVAEDVYGYEYDEIEEIDPSAIVDMIEQISDSLTLHERQDIATMTLYDAHGAMVRVAVAAEFLGHKGLVGDSNTSDQYDDMKFLNASDSLYKLCEYYSKRDMRDFS